MKTLRDSISLVCFCDIFTRISQHFPVTCCEHNKAYCILKLTPSIYFPIKGIPGVCALSWSVVKIIVTEKESVHEASQVSSFQQHYQLAPQNLRLSRSRETNPNVELKAKCSVYFPRQLGCPYMQESSIDWIFKVPACLVLIINLVFLFSIMWVSSRTSNLSVRPENKSPFWPPGAYNQAEVSEHGRDETVSKSFQSPTRTYSPLWADVSDCALWTKRRHRQEDFRHCTGGAFEYSGKAVHWSKRQIF